MRHGFLLIDKPRGQTSHDTVAIARRLLNEPKIGHIGTLDPGATGLLVLAVGAKALKVVEYFSGLTKSYEMDVRFGFVSTTYDADGAVEPVTPKPGRPEPTEIDVRRLIDDRFVGKIAQVPPAHSAVHVNGKRAYDLARQGKEVNIPARTVSITRCKIVSYAYPDLRLSVDCGSGTYMRSLAHDLGQMLHVGAYVTELRRTAVGEWDIKDACLPDDIGWRHVVPLKDVLSTLPGIQITAEEAEHLRFGRRIRRSVSGDTFAWFEGLPIAVLESAGDGEAKPRKVL
jgi:tRNA pseudouridine55 synthase